MQQDSSSRLASIGLRACSSSHTMLASYEITKSAIAAGIPGDIVECGVFAGSNAAAMALAVMDSGERRAIHLFDSFQGVPKCGPRDLEFIEANIPVGISACNLGSLQDNFREWEIDESLFVYHPGWFAETVPGSAIESIAVLRLDGDLYESTKVCMDHLHPKLSVGGWCIIDDFALSGCRDAVFETVVPGPVYFQKHS